MTEFRKLQNYSNLGVDNTVLNLRVKVLESV